MSLIIAINKKSETVELKRSDLKQWLTVFIPENLKELSYSLDYFEIFMHDHISISLFDLLNDVMNNIDYKKIDNLFGLSKEEKKIVDFIRSGKYQSIAIRVDKEKKPYLAELTEVKKLKMESRLYELINKGSYQDIEIKTQEGVIYSCKSTKKVKL